MPAWIGRKMLGFGLGRRFLNLFAGGKKLRTDGFLVFVFLRILASFRFIRRSSLGYMHEHAMIRRWLDSIVEALGDDHERALALARCGRLIKGYGETRQRTSSQLMAIVDRAADLPPANIKSLRDAALEDDVGEGFSKMLDSAA